MNKLLQLFKDLKFRNKLFLSYLVVILIPMLTFGIFAYIQAKSLLQEQAQQGLRNSVSLLAANIDGKVTSIDNSINSIVVDAKIQQVCEDENYELYTPYIELQNYFYILFHKVLNLNDLIKTMRVYTERTVAESGQFIQSDNSVKDSFWFTAQPSSRKTSWYNNNGKLLAARNFYSLRTNKRIGIVYLELDFQKLLNGIQSMNMPDYGIIITDADKKTVYEHQPNGEGLSADVQNSIVNNQVNYLDIHRKQYIVTKGYVPQAGWEMYFYVPTNSIAIKADKILQLTFFVVGVCIIVLLLVTWLFSKTFVKRIYELNKKIKLIHDGHLEMEIVSRSKDEIGELTNEFGGMMKEINHLIEEVYKGKITQREAELKALQAQINPHFLYNVLSVINWKAIKSDALDISQIAKKVSIFYRTTLNSGKNVISIEGELENTRAYVEIQLIMHNNRFDVRYDIDEQLYQYQMVNLILQPIVENAILHGIDQLENGGGLLQISGHLHESRIDFVVEDNGPGIKPEILEDIFITQTKGYGLRNVQERIKLSYGEPYGLEIVSDEHSGTKVTVIIPATAQI